MTVLDSLLATLFLISSTLESKESTAHHTVGLHKSARLNIRIGGIFWELSIGIRDTTKLLSDRIYFVYDIWHFFVVEYDSVEFFASGFDVMVQLFLVLRI